MDKETAEDVKDAVERDFDVHCRVAQTAAFMTKLLPVPESLITKVLKKMKTDQHYVGGRWKDFPSINSGHKEDAVYKAFIIVSNAIREAAEQILNDEGSSQSDRLGDNKWVDYHSRTPISQDKDAAPIRPDALLTLVRVQEQVEKMESEKAKASKVANLKLAVWWLQIVAAVEMKRSDTEKWEVLVKQLIGYLRRILREQLDRRFVFGFTLGPSQMSIWMHDRSGVLGTAESINIHENPEDFIRLIAAFVVLPADKLGFDPDMKLYVSPGVVMPSYKLDMQAYSTNPYDTKWVIRFSDGKDYLTVKTLSIARAGIMRGSGTIAWVVVPYHSGPSSGTGKPSQSPKRDGISTSNSTQERQQVFVLKQSWRPLGSKSEGCLYEFAKGSESKFVGAMHLCEDVMIRGEKDETAKLTRQSLDANSPPITAAGSKRDREEDQEPYLHLNCTDEGEIQSFWVSHARELVSRVRTRILLSTYGWPIKYFSTLGELLRVLHGAIQGHKHLYVNGLLHRDISPGNIIIEWQPGLEITPTNSTGRLIDLDHAKDGKKIESNSPVSQKTLPAHRLQLAVGLISDQIEQKAGISPEQLTIDAGVIHRAVEVYTFPIDYANYVSAAIDHALKFDYAPKDGILSCQTLCWEKIEKSYDFASGQLEHGSRTGTPPYTSGEILSNKSYFKDSRVYHDAVHDLESFFWVLVQICLTRKGPGAERREELTIDMNKVPVADHYNYQRLRTVVWCVFDSDFGRLRDNKRHIFNLPEILEPYILDNFHPYFTPLKPLVSEWFGLLHLAHHHRGFEYYAIHDRVLAILGKALNSGDSELDSLDEAGQKVLKAREDDIAQITRKANTAGQNVTHWELSPQGTLDLSQGSSARMLPPDSPTPATKRLKSEPKMLDAAR